MKRLRRAREVGKTVRNDVTAREGASLAAVRYMKTKTRMVPLLFSQDEN
jgi:hypothetical protein